jgi:preprotein translocase subunit SecE
MQAQVITKDLIAQHNLTDDEYKKIVWILGRELICIRMDS